MAVELTQYAKIKDNYCLVYLGSCEEYLLQLLLFRPIFERKYSGISIYLCSRNVSTTLDGIERTIKQKDIKDMRNMFAYIREIAYDRQHPIEELLKECDINEPIEVTPRSGENRCVIFSQGSYPTRSLDSGKIKQACKVARQVGYEVEIDTDVERAGWVMGVENQWVVRAAASGLRTTLISSGVGDKLFKTMFPAIEILDLEHI